MSLWVSLYSLGLPVRSDVSSLIFKSCTNSTADEKARSDPSLFVVLCRVGSVGAELEVQLGARDEELVLVVACDRRDESRPALRRPA